MEKILLDRNENNYGPAPACFNVLEQAGQNLFSNYRSEQNRFFFRDSGKKTA